MSFSEIMYRNLLVNVPYVHYNQGQKVSNHMESNKLHINAGKRCFMQFRPGLSRATQTCARTRPFNKNLTISIDGKKLEKVQYTKFLGVIIDDHKQLS